MVESLDDLLHRDNNTDASIDPFVFSFTVFNGFISEIWKVSMAVHQPHKHIYPEIDRSIVSLIAVNPANIHCDPLCMN